MEYIKGSIIITRFYIKHIFQTFNKLPLEMRNFDVNNKFNNDFTIYVDKKLSINYNNDMDDLYYELKKLLVKKNLNFQLIQYSVFLLRIIAIIFALYTQNINLVILISLLQIVIVPFSLIISAFMFIALFPPMFFNHVVSSLILEQIVPKILSFYITINYQFIFLFLLIDQILCLFCMKKSIIFKKKELLKHIFYGFLNCKTYNLLLLFTLYGTKINVTIWLIDAIFSLSERLVYFVNYSQILSQWTPLFYHMHRISHLPVVYEHAHKFHHYLYDSTPFDAHLYGAGLPEELCCLIFELLCFTYLGITPPFLSFFLLKRSYENKIGHTRKKYNRGGNNHHADHHTYHTRNYSIYGGLLDMFFETNADNNVYYYDKYKIAKIDKYNDDIIFNFQIL